MSEGSQVSKVTLCVKNFKWRSVTDWLTEVRYRAARAAKKNGYQHIFNMFFVPLCRLRSTSHANNWWPDLKMEQCHIHNSYKNLAQMSRRLVIPSDGEDHKHSLLITWRGISIGKLACTKTVGYKFLDQLETPLLSTEKITRIPFRLKNAQKSTRKAWKGGL